MKLEVEYEKKWLSKNWKEISATEIWINQLIFKETDNRCWHRGWKPCEEYGTESAKMCSTLIPNKYQDGVPNWN